MELKYLCQTHGSFLRVVLIVPLWNWNTSSWGEDALKARFNRTFMELKSQTAELYDNEFGF